MGKNSLAAAPTAGREQSGAFGCDRLSFFPEIFRYEAFNGDAGGLEDALRALEKLSRLAKYVQVGARHIESDRDIDDAVLDELATAVDCAAMNALAMFEEAKASGKGAA